MNSKVSQIFIFILSIFAAIWLATYATELPEDLQIFSLVTSVLIALLTLIFRKLPFDYKLVCLLMLGYAFAGRGFAYITPFDPVYIGEIIWCLCLLGYALRIHNGTKIFDTKYHIVLLIWILTVGIYLFVNFRTYGILSIRDSTIGYYGMFTFYGYAMFSRSDLSVSLGRILKLCIVGACLGSFLINTGLYYKIAELSPLIGFYFAPHPDSYLPFIAAGGMYGLLEGVRRKNILLLLLGGVAILLLFSTKTAGIFCLIILLIYFVIIGKRIDLILTTSIAALIAALTIGIMIAFESSHIENAINENEHLQSFYLGRTGNDSGSVNSDWRIAWWTIVAKDTVESRPFLGLGLGSDISSHFLQSYMRIDLSSEEAATYSRYPHNIIFTVFGRMGFLGLTIFLFMLTSVSLMLICVTRRYLNYSNSSEQTALLTLLIVIAGIANSFVQATFEVPFAAITFWFCLGYLMAFHEKNRRLSQQ